MAKVRFRLIADLHGKPKKLEKCKEMDALIEAISSCKYLYLQSISEPAVNRLRVVLLEAKTEALSGGTTGLARAFEVPPGPFSVARTIVHSPGCRIFEVFWDSYIGYAVQNESYSVAEPEESEGEGRLFVRCAKSRYLDHLTKATFASADFPGPFVHWGIYCLDHTIDVASMAAPRITISTHR